ncbi:transposase [Streptomyces sp. NPDC048254]|uniref:transposase n=1 Tax=Streptomyces sp. NPDC048254 TaxID=3365525 RepID=UPI003720C140
MATTLDPGAVLAGLGAGGLSVPSNAQDLWIVARVAREGRTFQRVVPEAPTRPQGGGRRRHGDREVPAAIVFVATSGCTWQQLPSASFGPSGATAHRRFAEWSKARVWAKLHRLVLDELGSRGELDWSRCAIDSVNMRALKRGT